MIGSTKGRMAAEIARQSQLSKDIAQAQIDVSSKTRLHAASDDPVASARVSSIRRAQGDASAYAANIRQGAVIANSVDTALEVVQTTLDQARELLIAGRSGTLNAEDRAIIANQLRGLADDVIAQGAVKDSLGRPLFPDGEPLQVPIADGITVAATVSKTRAFADLEVQLRAAADALGIPDDATRTATTAAALDRLNAASETLNNVRAEQGVRAARLDAADDRLATASLDLADERSSLEDTDIAQAMAFIQSSLLTLNAAQTTFARVSSQTLFDVLR